MIWKTVTLLSFALCVLGGGHHATSEQRIKIHPQEHHGHHGDLKHIGSSPPEHHEEYAWSYPSYEFSYKVHDPHTHDMKGQQESRHGDEVKGEYWLVQPDGHKRTVSYHADKHHGFKATVEYTKYHHGEDDHGHEEKHDGEGHDEEKHHGVEEKHDEGHGGDEGHKEEGGRDGQESRGHDEYRQAWAVAREAHGKKEGRRQESQDDYKKHDEYRSHDFHRGGDIGRGRDYSDMTGYGNMGSFGRKVSGRDGHSKDDGRSHGESHGWEERHKHQHQGLDTFNYPRFYRQTHNFRSQH